jgi:hypothetical protein
VSRMRIPKPCGDSGTWMHSNTGKIHAESPSVNKKRLDRQRTDSDGVCEKICDFDTPMACIDDINAMRTFSGGI